MQANDARGYMAHVRCPGCKRRLFDIRTKGLFSPRVEVIIENRRAMYDTTIRCPQCKLYVGVHK